MVIGGGSGGLACSKEGDLICSTYYSLILGQICVKHYFVILSVFTAAQLAQKVAVLDYVEPSVTGRTISSDF